MRYFAQARVVIGAKGTGGEFLASGSKKECVLAVARGVLDAVAALPKLLAKRAQVMRRRKVGTMEMLRLLRRHRLTFRELLDVR